jgi:hypothetical protein
MTGNGNNRSAEVAAATLPKQAEEIYARWPWVEYAVWTERMLTRLEQSEPKLCIASHQRPPTGKPDAGNPPVRFGGRGGVQTSIPTPIL